jgi:hypothetical protein
MIKIHNRLASNPKGEGKKQKACSFFSIPLDLLYELVEPDGAITCVAEKRAG